MPEDRILLVVDHDPENCINMNCNTPLWPLLEVDRQLELERSNPINQLVITTPNSYLCPYIYILNYSVIPNPNAFGINIIYKCQKGVVNDKSL